MTDKLATEFTGLIIPFEKQSSIPELSHTAITFSQTVRIVGFLGLCS